MCDISSVQRMSISFDNYFVLFILRNVGSHSHGMGHKATRQRPLEHYLLMCCTLYISRHSHNHGTPA